MTTPGGVANLPPGALTLDTLRPQLQDMSPEAMRARAAARIPGTYDTSTGGSPTADLSPFGILIAIWAAVNSRVATADPADIQSPEDLPDLLTDFIESIPVVGEFVELLAAITGTYDGDADVLLTIQDIFAPVRALLQLVANTVGGVIPTAEQLAAGFGAIIATITHAQNTANNAMQEVNALKAKFFAGDGASYVDNLDYTSTAYLPSPYIVYESGPGAGTYGPNGSSALEWKASGASDRCCLYVNPDMVLSGGKYGAAIVVENTANFSGPINYLGIADSSGNGVGVGFSINTFGLVTFTAGVPSSIIDPVSYSAGAGDSWEIYYGVAGYPQGVLLTLNSDNVAVETDSGVTFSGDVFLAVGAAATGFFFTQALPARTGSFTFFESSL